MDNVIYTRGYNAPPWDRREILRYAGARGDAPELAELLENCISEVEGMLVYKVCYRELPISFTNGAVDLGFARTSSAGLIKNLSGCEGIMLFAATVGISLDRAIARYSSVSPTRSLMLQAIGSERIEALCDLFCSEIKEEKRSLGLVTRPRFSPGYGDLPLEMQKEIFAVLDCQRRIGITLNGSLLMSPSKSVTAIIGVGK